MHIHLNIISRFIILLVAFTGCNTSNEHLEIKKFQSEALSKSLLNVSSEKKIAVYLPPSYFSSEKKYPVIYYLPGFTSPIDELIGGEYEGFRIHDTMDELIESAKILEMIVVLCDGSNFLGGNFYTNSPLTGNAEDYIVEDIVAYIDTNYRTIASPKARGIAGHSMGGYGSFNIATKHPDVFSICYAISPGIYDGNGLRDHKVFDNEDRLATIEKISAEVQSMTKQDKKRSTFKRRVGRLFSGSYNEYYAGFTFAYGAAFNHDVSLPFPFIEIPKQLMTEDNLNDPGFKKWQNGFGNWEDKIVQRKEKLLQLDAIAFDCGHNDAWITSGTKYIVDVLKTNNIEVEAFWHEGGHDDKLHSSIKESMLPYFSEKFYKND